MIWHWWQSALFVLITIKKLCSTKSTAKIYSAASTGRRWGYTKYVSFPWPPMVAIHYRKGLARARLAAEVTCCIKTILIPGFSYVHYMLLFASNCAKDDFPSKLRLLRQLLRLRGRRLNMLEYTTIVFFPSPPWPALWHFPGPLFGSVAVRFLKSIDCI